MSSYFKPLRRKIGVVTLLLACLFAGGWMRSRTHADWILLFGRIVVVSGNQRIFVLGRSRTARMIVLESTTRRSESLDEPVSITSRRVETVLDFDHAFTDQFGWRNATTGGVMTEFGIGTDRPQMLRDMFTYRSIVISLAFISGLLLLTKPRSRSRVTNREPEP